MSETRRLLFRAPFEHRPPTLGELLERAWPEGTDEGLRRALEQGRVEVDGRIVRDPDAQPGATATVSAEVEPELVEYDAPEATALERGDDWVIADKPAGMPGRLDPEDPMHPIYFLADRLGLDRDTFTPVWPMPPTAAGPWLFGHTPADASRLRRRWTDGDLMVTWLALVPTPDIPQGTLDTPEGCRIQYATTTMREGLAELQMTVSRDGDDPPESFDLTARLREALADEGTPILGDRRHGGYMVRGALRLRLAALFDRNTDLQLSWNAPEDWFPSEPVVPPEPDEPEGDAEIPTAIEELDLPELTVHPATLERLRERGHPWIRPGEVAGRHDHIRPGTVVRLRGTNDIHGPVALVDSRADIAARVWSRTPLDAAEFEETVRLRAEEALANRRELIRDSAQTDLFRLMHGEADGLPGIAVDRVGPVLRAHVQGAAAYAFREELYEVLRAGETSRMIIEMEPEKSTGRGARIAHSAGSYLGRDRELLVREAGLRYRLDPWSARLAVDPSHRTTRSTVRELAGEGERWCLAVTPAARLAIPLAAAGCDSITVAAADDASGLREQLEFNGLDDGVLDPRRPAATFEHLDGSETYDGVAVDLDVGVEVEREGRELDRCAVAERAMASVAPGGWMVLIVAPERGGDDVESIARRAAEAAEIELEETAAIHPPADFPLLESFPEGTPYAALRARRLEG